MVYTPFDLMLTFICAAGIIVMFWALYEETKEKTPIYVKLATIAAALSIAATFLAAITH